MTQTIITAKNGKARHKNPYPKSVLLESEPRIWGINPKWKDFESAVQWHDCPEATEDGEFEAELVTQYRPYEPNGDWQFHMPEDKLYETRQVWRIVPQPQEKQTMNSIKIRKRIFELEAILLNNNPKSIYEMECFIEGVDKLDTSSSRMASDKWDDYIDIISKQGGRFLKTLESNGETQLASFGDYIIKGIKGEFYPCKPEIFKELYEVISPIDNKAAPKKEEAKTVEGKTAEEILSKILNTQADLLDCGAHCRVSSALEAMQSYSSQQNTALMEENERLKNLINDLHSSLNNWPSKYSILEMVDLTNLNKIK